ncbi:MAG: PAS domain S-box protein [Candidatus Bathyarchaeota archaeon]|nr:PAS domain S-box protein [Candidatus Bathyarchaeota archaeon]
MDSIVDPENKIYVEGFTGKPTKHFIAGSDEIYRRLFEGAMDAIVLSDAETGVILGCNQEATKLTGRSKSELIGMHHSLLYPKDQTEKVARFKAHLKERLGTVIETVMVTKSGERRDVAIKSNFVEVKGQKIVQCVFRDITVYKANIKKLRFQASLLGAVGQVVVAADKDGKITFWNSVAEQVFGWSEKEMLGAGISKVFPDKATDILGSLKEGVAFTTEKVVQRRDGRPLAMLVKNFPLLDAAGFFQGSISVFTDITEQKWMLDALSETIDKIQELNEKLHVVESLTRHDVRNKLSAMNGYLYLLKRQLRDNPTLLTYVTQLEASSKQILSILDCEKIYVQVGAEELTYVDVGMYFQEATLLFSDLSKYTLINKCNGVKVLADSLLRQLFYNLLDNTIKYGGNLSTIKLSYTQNPDAVELIYEDDGNGIPENLKSHLFQKGFGKGTGMGLYMMKRMCDAYGWAITETGKEGEGVQFVMTIPKKQNKEGQATCQLPQPN